MGKISKNETSVLIGLDREHNLNYTITLGADGTWYYIYDKENSLFATTTIHCSQSLYPFGGAVWCAMRFLSVHSH